jgi:Predicted membrane protein (DUF2207)
MLRMSGGVLLALVLAAPAAANEYRAERFDSRIEVLKGGDLRITETIVFRFEEGTFKTVFRVIPTRRTDGVEFVSAAMDGTEFPQGKGPGHVSVKRKDGLRVDWTFAPVRASTHTFELTYVARGVVRVEGDADVMTGLALPKEHKYVIDRSAIDVILPADPLSPPSVSARRVENSRTEMRPGHVLISATDIGRNGWIELSIPLPRGSVLEAPPAWQQRRWEHDSYRNPALLASAFILLGAVILIFGMRQGYDSPPRDITAPDAFSGPPDPLPPALAGALSANGSAKSEHAFGTLFALAQRGVLAVEEERGLWGTRSFRLVRQRSPERLAPHEQAAIDTIFSGKAAQDEHITLSKAHSHLTLRFSRFRKVLWRELVSAGLIDQGRAQVQKNYQAVGVALLVLALVGLLPVAWRLQQYGPWWFFISVALFVASIGSFIAAGAHTPLSNEGVRRAASWRAYRKFLRELPADGGRREAWHADHSPSKLLPFAIALGLGMVWSKLYKNRGTELPAWFHAMSGVDAHRSFVAFVSVGGATGGSAGSAAGGGASGAG